MRLNDSIVESFRKNCSALLADDAAYYGLLKHLDVLIEHASQTKSQLAIEGLKHKDAAYMATTFVGYEQALRDLKQELSNTSGRRI